MDFPKQRNLHLLELCYATQRVGYARVVSEIRGVRHLERETVKNDDIGRQSETEGIYETIRFGLGRVQKESKE